MQTKLSLSGVSYVYSARTPFEMQALNDVSIDFPAGKITGIIGHTGSGKSTIAQMLNGLLKPTAGTVFLDGEDIFADKKRRATVCYRVGLVMQYPEYQLFEETVGADIAFGPKNAGLSEEEVAERVRMAADFVGLSPDILDRSPFDLSGGQKRRVAVAGIMAMRPEVLVLDEPAAGLDPRGKREILSGIRRYRDEVGATVIIVSHSMEDMAMYCDYIAVMNHGELFMQGTADEVFSHPKELLSIGLGIPAVTELAEILFAEGVPLSGALYTVDGVEAALLSLLEKGGKTHD